MLITSEVWGTLPDGSPVHLYRLSNAAGNSVSITDLGATIVSVIMPDASGNRADVVLGYDTPEEYLAGGNYFGATVGRYANRIGGGTFTLNGQQWNVTVNQGENCLHGGSGIHKKLWTGTVSEDGLLLQLHSPHGEDGFPGNLEISVLFSLSADNRLTMSMTAVSDRDTVCCLTNHSYFNLTGSGNTCSHLFRIFADQYTPFLPNKLPDGTLQSVEGTLFDFREARPLPTGKLDVNYAIPEGQELYAEVSDPSSGRMLRVFSDLPAMVFYTAGGLPACQGKGGSTYGPNSGFCLEPQYFPNAPNMPQFPSCVLKKGSVYRHTIQYQFSAQSPTSV